MVVVDSSVWIDFLKRPAGAAGQEMARLLRSNDVLMVGVVLAEVLLGIGEREQADVRLRLAALPYVETTKAAWLQAAELLVALRGQGRMTPLTDLVIAAQALDGDHDVYTLDEHFQRVPGLKLHEVGP